MALLDIFKKKKPKEKVKEIKEVKKPPKVKVVKKAKEKVVRKEEKITGAPIRKTREKKIGKAWQVLKFPHITEKATNLVPNNQYIFTVLPGANKTEIGKAIGDIYGVDVVDVKIINIPAKKRRLGRTLGYKSGYKKAIIKIKEGQKIEVLPR